MIDFIIGNILQNIRIHKSIVVNKPSFRASRELPAEVEAEN